MALLVGKEVQNVSGGDGGEGLPRDFSDEVALAFIEKLFDDTEPLPPNYPIWVILPGGTQITGGPEHG